LENYTSQSEDQKGLLALKYMLLCKIMMEQSEDVAIITNSKIALKYSGRDLDAMKAIAQSHINHSLHDFENSLGEYSKELQEDVVVHTHLKEFYDTLLENHLCCLIEPYSRVEISHISELTQLKLDLLERKLSQMILDKKLKAVLDQGQGLLITYEEHPADSIHSDGFEVIQSLISVMDSLSHLTKRSV
jgi:26S proteasome regulatory subunit N6